MANIVVDNAGRETIFMAMDWQQIAALGIVGGTASLFVWSRFRRRKFSFERDTHCGCNGGSAPGSSILFHARKGERPQVVVRTK